MRSIDFYFGVFGTVMFLPIVYYMIQIFDNLQHSTADAIVEELRTRPHVFRWLAAAMSIGAIGLLVDALNMVQPYEPGLAGVTVAILGLVYMFHGLKTLVARASTAEQHITDTTTDR